MWKKQNDDAFINQVLKDNIALLLPKLLVRNHEI